jgi:polyhydroxyalkanoate synthesis regulator phasin
MSDEKNKVTDKASEIAKNIWLAGVGAYGKAVEEAQGRLEKAMEPPKLFRDLVKAGTALEEDARESTASAKHSVEERINRVRENFHNQRPARIEDLVALHKKVDQLTRKVDKLSKALAEQGLGKTSKSSPKPASRSATTRATASKTKTPSARAARKKSAGAKKTTTRKAPASSKRKA